MAVTTAYKVYGEEGHRQKMSFSPSFRRDWSNEWFGTRIFEALGSDLTETNEYSTIRITRDTKEECERELNGQISDGFFENSRVGKVVAIDPQEVTDLLEKRLHELWEELEDIPMDPETECMEAPFAGFDAGTHREEIWHWIEDTYHVSVAEDLMYGYEEPER